MLERADRLALEAERPDLAALCLNYLGDRARRGRRRGAGWRRCATSIALALARRPPRGRRARLLQPRRAARAHRAARRARAVRARRAGVHPRARVLVTRLQPRGAPLRRCWSGAATGTARSRRGCARWSAAEDDPGILYAYSVPWLGRLLARRGDPRREATARRRRGSARSASGCCSASPTRGSRGWSGRGWPATSTAAREVARVLLPRTEHPGGAPFRGELLRYLARAGLDPPSPLRRTARTRRLRRGGGPARRVAHGRGALAPRRRSLRDRAGARAQRRAGRDRRRPGDPRPARRDAGGRARAHRAAASAARASPAAPTPPRAATPPGSRSASWRCWRSCARG